MNIDKLNKWADLLLDTGKRNNLISFKDSKTGTVEILSPDFDVLFSKAEHSAQFEVYDPKLDEDEEVAGLIEEIENIKKEQDNKYISKKDYLETYGSRIKKNSQILAYNGYVNPITALRNIGKKAQTAIEETGVNIAYIAFGFINWAEKENQEQILRAPILLAPIAIINESAVEPYHVKITDSEFTVNPTFSFRLKNDFGVELPEYNDESISEYLIKVESCVSKLKWSVTKECKIGIFSFLKINMHKDLKDNATKILENKGVRSLLGETGFDTTTIDFDKEKAMALHNVVDADSSQTEAIELARSGKSFVLQGPPGTGKSQTITNIIAECLADGKKVLFVSEKLAALSVVYDKLKKAGLEEFCLELHSHKSNKKDVIEELCHTLKAQKSALSHRAQKEVEDKLRAQKQLDEYAVELHKVREKINKSLYELYEELSACRHAPSLDFVIKEIKSKGEEYVREAEILLSRYTEYLPSIGYDYHKNVWYGYLGKGASFETVSKLKVQLQGVVCLCENLLDINQTIGKKYGITAKNLCQAHALKDFFKLIKDSEFITPRMLNYGALLNIKNTVNTMKGLASEILAKKRVLEQNFDQEIYKINGQNFYKKLTRVYDTFFSRLFSGEYRDIIKEVRFCKKDGKRVNYKLAVSVMDTLQIYQSKLKEFNALESKIKGKIGGAYDGVNTDFLTLTKDIEELLKIQSLGVTFGSLATLNYQDYTEKRTEFADIYDSYEGLFTQFGQDEKQILAQFDLEKKDLTTIELDRFFNKINGCLESVDNLDNWCEFSKLVEQLDQMELLSFVDFIIKQKVKEEQIVSAYKKAFYSQWVDAVLHESKNLISLSRIPHDEAVKLFKIKDQLHFEINKAKIKAELSAERPNLDMVAQGSAIAILLRESEKKRKQKGIRLLLEEIGELVQTLKPCFLMSPLSVSTFLSPDMKFDVVIFDEASQIFPQDAVGAIYRGNQLIVVGDSKQMPPSNFFNSAVQEETDEEFDDVTDFESILDICATAFPQKRLKWHYRSRFEQLISFSNKNFYENDLVTFPSSKKDAKDIGVDYYHVDGVFDRKTRTNRIEAEKIVDLVFEHVKKYPERSLGVVAFSISQQNLIDRLISKRRLFDPRYEDFFKSDNAEPFFVKNLETVQGDERDTIIFSVAYGKDVDGRLILNFGPVNKEGGERRLNVAVTRAKYNVQLVSSMHYTDIDLTRTQSQGARLLREYLDYAENGEIALERAETINPFENERSDFILEVSEFLKEKGYAVDTKVGCSSFKIDIALKDPNSNDYLLAIVCDGEIYRNSKNARDRDRLCQEILERMGWKFYRIWSTDWFRNKRVEKDRLIEVVKLAVESSKTKQKKEKAPINGVSFEEVSQEKPFEFPKYVMVGDYYVAQKHNHDRFKVIREIVEFEAPISEEWLLKRVCFLFGREKVTSVVRQEYQYLMRNCADYNIVRKNGFLYIKDKEIPMLRVPYENATYIREIKYICLEELAQGMKEILKQNVSVQKGGLFLLLIKQLGFTRGGDAVMERLESALHLISNDIEINGEVISRK